jgi:hypothetical protein
MKVFLLFFQNEFTEPHLLIMSYEMRGKLLSLLRTARGVMNSGNLYHTPNRETAMPLSPRRLTGFAYDIAKGMEYIAEKGVSELAFISYVISYHFINIFE